MDGRLRPDGFLDLSFLARRKSDTTPTPKDFVIRASTVSDMLLCMGRQAIPAALEWPPFPPTEAMMFGTVTHGLIEDRQQGLSRSSKEVAIAALVEDGFHAGDISYMLTPLLREAEQAYLRWLEQVEPHILLAGRTEGRMFRPLGTVDGRPLWLRGTPDYITDHVIYDWKTSKTKWQKGRESKTIQLPLYRSLAEWNHEVMPGIGLYVIYARDKGTWEFRETELTDRKVTNAMIHAYTMGRGLMKQEYTLSPFGEFRERGWYCSSVWCNAWDVCPMGGGDSEILLPALEQ
jgi:hypothetical protein